MSILLDELVKLLGLERIEENLFRGQSQDLGWGTVYGGQVLGQALSAAAQTVPADRLAHSLHAYFLRPGDVARPVLYEVDRIRDGRSFTTRRVVARQAVGAILNLEASFQRDEGSADVETLAPPPELPTPDLLEPSSWSAAFERAFVPADRVSPAAERDGRGRATAWLRTTEPIGGDRFRQAAALAYMSDDLPTDAVVQAHPVRSEPDETLYKALFTASLDHTIWFHRPLAADRWHLHDFTCHTFVGGRGLSLGQIFALDGTHVATVAQEVLLRDTRDRTS